MPEREEVSAWETYDQAAAKQARSLTYRRSTHVQADGSGVDIDTTSATRRKSMPEREEVSAWETYEKATAKQARKLTYRRSKLVQADGGRVDVPRRSVCIGASGRGRRSVAARPNSIAERASVLGLANVDIEALEKLADEAELERRNSCRDYSTPFSHFFDTLGYDRRKGDLSAIEQASQEKNLSPSVKDWLLEIFSVYFEKHVHFEELQQRERGACSSATKCLKKINGTMPESQDYILNHLPLPQFVLFIELCMRGIGQVVFQNNPLSGLLILIGLFVQSTRVAVHGIIGLICGTLIAYPLGFDTGLKRSGLFGYNSVLCGLAMATFYSSDMYQGYSAAVIISTIIFSSFSSILFVFMGKILAPYKSPPFTLPFNVSVLMYLLATANMSRVNTGSVRAPMLPVYDGVADTSLSALDFFAGCVRGVGQIFLADNVISGFLVLAGFSACSRISALAALAGSTLGSVVGLASGVSGAAVTSGMFGFNSSLTFTAIFMFYTPSYGAFILATLSGIMTVLAQQALATFLEPYGLPFMTLPFCLVSLPFVILQGTTSLVIAVPLSTMTIPEDHLRKVRYLKDGFLFLKEALHPEIAKDFKRRSVNIKALKVSLRRISVILDEEVDGHDNKESCWSIVQRLVGKVQEKSSIKESWVLKAAPKMFKELDSKKQGSIFAEDLTGALMTVGLNDKTGIRFASLVFDLMDLDKSNSIELKEWVVFCLVSVELMAVRKNISKFFDFVDIDGNEVIDFEEIDAALDYLGEPPLTVADRKTLLSVCTIEEDDGVDIVEIINYVTVAKVKQMMNECYCNHTESLVSHEDCSQP